MMIMRRLIWGAIGPGPPGRNFLYPF